MSEKTKLLTAVLANPDADEPRDRLSELWMRTGDPRGELISVQMKLARQQGNGPQLRKRAREMIEKHGRQWSGGIADLVDKFYFRRGFVEHIQVEASAFLQIAETLYALAPIRHLTLTGAHAVANDLFASPHLSRIVSIALEHCGLTDDDATLMAASPHMSRVRWLVLGWNEIGRPVWMRSRRPSTSNRSSISSSNSTGSRIPRCSPAESTSRALCSTSISRR